MAAWGLSGSWRRVPNEASWEWLFTPLRRESPQKLSNSFSHPPPQHQQVSLYNCNVLASLVQNLKHACSYSRYHLKVSFSSSSPQQSCEVQWHHCSTEVIRTHSWKLLDLMVLWVEFALLFLLLWLNHWLLQAVFLSASSFPHHHLPHHFASTHNNLSHPQTTPHTTSLHIHRLHTLHLSTSSSTSSSSRIRRL